MLTVLSQKTVKIRKPQKCWGCCREFQPGSRLYRVECVDNGDFSRAYWCAVCQEIINDMDSYNSDMGFGFGDIKDGDPEWWKSVRVEIETENDRKPGQWLL